MLCHLFYSLTPAIKENEGVVKKLGALKIKEGKV
jgi:hypothetical protein